MLAFLGDIFRDYWTGDGELRTIVRSYWSARIAAFIAAASAVVLAIDP